MGKTEKYCEGCDSLKMERDKLAREVEGLKQVRGELQEIIRHLNKALSITYGGPNA